MTDQELDKLFEKSKRIQPSTSVEDVNNIITNYDKIAFRKKIFSYSINLIIILIIIIGGLKYSLSDDNFSKQKKEKKEPLVEEKGEDRQVFSKSNILVDTLIEIKAEGNSDENNIKNNSITLSNNVELIDIEENRLIIKDTFIGDKEKEKELIVKEEVIITRVKEVKVEEYKFILSGKSNKKQVANFFESLKKEGVRMEIEKEKYGRDGHISKLKGIINKSYFDAENFEKIFFLLKGDYNQCQISIIKEKEVYKAEKDRNKKKLKQKKYHINNKKKKSPWF